MRFIRAVPAQLGSVRLERGGVPAPVQDKPRSLPDPTPTPDVQTSQDTHRRKMMMTMKPGLDDLTKKRMLQARALSKEARGGGLKLGKKISVPQDVMMEELNLPSNRGSRMFQERQRRVEKYILESVANGTHSAIDDHPQPIPLHQTIRGLQGGKQNQALSHSGKHNLLTGPEETVSKEGSAGGVAPGHSHAAKSVPHEKFNTTVIAKTYCSPWRAALGQNEEPVAALCSQLSQVAQRQQPVRYRCFNRSPKPFGGVKVSRRAIPVIGFEAVKSQDLPGVALDRLCRRPTFNRAPKGWGVDYCPESNEL